MINKKEAEKLMMAQELINKPESWKVIFNAFTYMLKLKDENNE